ncbi:MAG TPA: PIN domain-containing protein [Gammaproteobacteria bacterium]|nr:PIN domain-containing protein [Gammaproteobacteria bacterium]
MKATIDTSALIAVIGHEASRDKIIEITKGYSLFAPVSVHWEIGNAFSAMFKRKKSDLEKAKRALAAYREIPIKYIDVPLERTLEISDALNIYAYDAYLIQCAQQTSTPLLTLDTGLITAAKKMGIHILELNQ